MNAAERLNQRLALGALGLAAVAAIGVHAYLGQISRRALQPQTAPVLVAASTVPAHTQLTANMLRVAQFTPGTVPTGALTNLSQAVGSITVAPIFAGQPLVQSDLSGTHTPASLGYAVAPGQRAYTVAVGPTSGVGEMIQPGDHVDVLATFTAGTTATVDTIEEDVLVLAVGQRFTGQGGPIPTSYTDVTLQLSPAQVQVVQFAVSRGQVSLSLRNVTDQTTVTLPPETGSGLAGS